MDRRVSVRSHLVVLFALLVFALPWTVFGQAQNGTITGTITDNSGEQYVLSPTGVISNCSGNCAVLRLSEYGPGQCEYK